MNLSPVVYSMLSMLAFESWDGLLVLACMLF
jgi:hypothetical protein